MSTPVAIEIWRSWARMVASSSSRPLAVICTQALGVRDGLLSDGRPDSRVITSMFSSLAAQTAATRRNLRRAQLAAQQRDDVTLLALLGHPRFVVGQRRRAEAHLHTQLVAGKEQVLEHRRRVVFVGNLDQHAQRDIVVDHRLADVEHVDAMIGQHARARGRPARCDLCR